MDTYRYDRQEPPSFKGTRRVVTAQPGPYTSLQLPVTVCNEQYKSVIDVGLPTSLISTAIWQKVSSPLYPIGENQIAERVTRRTNLQLMGYTHFQLQVGQTVLELEDALVYDYDEPEIFLSISAVAALGLIVDFQEGTFGLRSVDGLRCSWNEDTVLYPSNKLGNFTSNNMGNFPSNNMGNLPSNNMGNLPNNNLGNLNLNKPKPSPGSYYDYTGSANEGHHTNNMVPYHAPGNLRGTISQDRTSHIPIGIDDLSIIPGLGDLNYNEIAPMPPQPMDLGPIQPPGNTSLNPYPMVSAPMGMGPVKKKQKQRKSVNSKKFKNFFLKVNQSKGRPPISKFLIKIANWKKDKSSKESSTNTNKSTTKNTTVPPKTASVKQGGVNSSTASSPNVQSTNTKNQKRKAKRKLQAEVTPGSEKKVTAPKTITNSDNKNVKAQKRIQCVNCHSTDHTMHLCTEPLTLKCVYCGQPGHVRTNCPTIMKTSSAVADTPEITKTVSPTIPVAESLQSSADASVTEKPESETTDNTSTPVAKKRPAGSPEDQIVKKQIIETNSEKPVEKTTSVSSANTQKKLPVTSFDPLRASDDFSKKPELDVVEHEPVKRVVAKKNIKLNMLPKSNTSVSKEDSSDTENALSSHVKDMPVSETETTALQKELVPDVNNSSVVNETLVPKETTE